MIAVSTLLKSCAMPPASWPIACIFWLCAKFSCERALLGRVEREDDRARAFAACVSAAEMKKPRGSARVVQRQTSIGRDVGLAFAGRRDRGAQRRLVALGDAAENGGPRVAGPRLERGGRQLGEGAVGAQHEAVGVDRRRSPSASN